MADAKTGRETPDWLWRVATADHDPDWQPGGRWLARLDAWRERYEREQRRAARRARWRAWWRRVTRLGRR